MPRVYKISGSIASVTASLDLLQIVGSSTRLTRLLSLKVTNDTDETSEMIPLKISRFTTAGSGGTANTPRPIDAGDAAFSGTVLLGNNTQATGTETVLERLASNIIAGWHFVPVPEERILIRPSAILVVRLITSPSTAGTYSVNASVMEEG